MSGCLSTGTTSPRSTTRPAYITITRSAISATTPRLWVMKITAIPVRRWRSCRSSRICACTVTSRAVVGSSAIRRLGLAGERHRDHDPLPHPAGEVVRVAGEPLPASSGCPPAPGAPRHGRVPPCGRSSRDAVIASAIWSPIGVDRVQRGHRLLEDHRDLVAAHRPHPASGERQEIVHAHRGRGTALGPRSLACGGGGVRRMMARLVTLLPEPDSPTSASVSPGRTAKETSWTAGISPAIVLKRHAHGHPERSSRISRHQWRSSRASSASRRPSPTKLKLVTASVIARPGKMASQGAEVR